MLGQSITAAASAALAAQAAPALAAERSSAEPFGYCLNTSTIRGQKLPLVKELEIAARAGTRTRSTSPAPAWKRRARQCSGRWDRILCHPQRRQCGASHDEELEPTLEEASYLCDSCGEEIVISVDVSAGTRQQYVEDCPVCCHPNVIRVEVDEAGEVSVRSEHE